MKRSLIRPSKGRPQHPLGPGVRSGARDGGCLLDGAPQPMKVRNKITCRCRNQRRQSIRRPGGRPTRPPAQIDSATPSGASAHPPRRRFPYCLRLGDVRQPRRAARRTVRRAVRRATPAVRRAAPAVRRAARVTLRVVRRTVRVVLRRVRRTVRVALRAGRRATRPPGRAASPISSPLLAMLTSRHSDFVPVCIRLSRTDILR